MSNLVLQCSLLLMSKRTKDPCIRPSWKSHCWALGGHLPELRNWQVTHTERKEACLTPRLLFGWNGEGTDRGTPSKYPKQTYDN